METSADDAVEYARRERLRAARAARPGPSLSGALSGTWQEMWGVVRDHATLAVLEAQQAGVRLAVLIGMGLVVAVLLVTAWLALVIALAVWLLGTGMSWPAVLGIAALLNVVIAAIIAWAAKSTALQMPFSATLRQLAADRREAASGDADA